MKPAVASRSRLEIPWRSALFDCIVRQQLQATSVCPHHRDLAITLKGGGNVPGSSVTDSPLNPDMPVAKVIDSPSGEKLECVSTTGEWVRR